MQLFSFQYRWPHVGEEIPRVDVWKTLAGAEKAARKWQADMAGEGGTIDCRVVELIREGSSRRAEPVTDWA